MSDRVTRSQTGKTPRNSLYPDMVETPSSRRTRRSTPSTPTTANSSGDDSSSFESNSQPSTKKRGRGRLRKSVIASSSEEDDDEPELLRLNQKQNQQSRPELESMSNSMETLLKVDSILNDGNTSEHVPLETKIFSLYPALEGAPPKRTRSGTLKDQAAAATPFDFKIDHSDHKEFGGALGVTCLMLAFPLLMYYMWIGATFYGGKAPLPAAGQSWTAFAEHLAALVYSHAYPSAKAWAIYWAFFVTQMAFYLFMPGVYAEGKPLPHLGGKKLKYYCSGVASWWATIVIACGLHLSGLFKLYTILDEFGSIMSVAIITGYMVAVVAYVSALWRGVQHRMTGSLPYDFFMGAELNPRLFGWLDFKMFFEVRLPWFILFLVSVATAARQYDQNGYVSPEVGFIVMAHFLYANACCKGEELIVTTWDMYYEKWGFMLIFWNLAGVPLSYCHCTLYLANHHPSEYRWPTWALSLLFVSYLFVYWVWDTCNSQKNIYRQTERGNRVERVAFPQLPYREVKNPFVIQTKVGDSLLCDGWYGKARKVHYACDAFFAICWGLITGFNSPFPWFYPVFFCAMIAHRAMRDIERCREKYGEAWEEYTRRVPYLFVPYVF